MPRWLTITFTLLMLGVAMPTTADDKDDCVQRANPDVSIRSCTNLIQSGRLQGDDLAIVFFNRGVVFGRDRGDFDRAIADFDKAIEINSRVASYFFNRGVAYDGKGDIDRAIADYSQAIERDPDDARSYLNRGRDFGRDKITLDRAIADFDKAIELNPDDALAFNNRGSAYSAKDDTVRAILDYNRAIELDPDDAIAYYNRGSEYPTRPGRSRRL